MSLRPLTGIRVLDFSKVLAGPLCGQYLGELGADVIKIEPPDTGDDTRSWFPQKEGISATYLAVNHNKRSLGLNLKHPGSRDVVKRLVENADVVLQGFGGRTGEKLGVDDATLRAINPRLIYVEVSGYGREGPKGNDPGYDVMLQAFSGMLATMGEPGGGFARASFSPIDMSTGMYAMSGVLAALLERGRTGKGTYLEVSLLDTALGLMSYPIQNFWQSGKLPQRMGTGHPAMAPYQAFEAKDGPMMIGVGNDAQWKRFCEAAGLQDIVADPDFATNAARVANFDRIVAIVQERVRKNTVAEWLALLAPASVPCSPIHTVAQALAHPQVATRGLIEETQHPVLGTLQQVGLPVRFDGAPREAARTPPLLGEHTEEILREAGYADADIAALRAAGTIA
ncbi:CaiB/BaiF CoA transferase family protein [Ramlibacter sp.]|uniref:CaiB/BaiF CoA transferase family protein n=1 Tax=Ramlibacter sp. TaxID=1917967 RepID=UPI003D0D9064